MEESAALARRLGLQLHTHLAETVEEDAYCRELYGCTPVEYLERVGWLADDVWCAHCVHLSDDDVQTFARTGVGVAHCPTSNLRLGAGVAPVRAMLDAGVRVGLGVDGSASNERERPLRRGEERAARRARPRRPGGADGARRAAARDARRRRGAAPRRHRLARSRASAPTSRSGAPTGSSSAAPTTSSRTSSLSGPHRVDRLLVGGRDVVRGGALVNAREEEIAREHRDPGCETLGGMTTVSTHVLDTERGAPAAGVHVELLRADGTIAGEGVTDDDGRIRDLADTEPGTYRIVFHPASPFFRRVELEVELGDGHYHVPLLVSSYACATYRGS